MASGVAGRPEPERVRPHGGARPLLSGGLGVGPGDGPDGDPQPQRGYRNHQTTHPGVGSGHDCSLSAPNSTRPSSPTVHEVIGFW